MNGENQILCRITAVYRTKCACGRNLAKAIGKDAQYIRYGLQKGIFSFGYAIKLENSSEYNYYCPDRKVWEETGYFRQEDKKEKTLA